MASRVPSPNHSARFAQAMRTPTIVMETRTARRSRSAATSPRANMRILFPGSSGWRSPDDSRNDPGSHHGAGASTVTSPETPSRKPPPPRSPRAVLATSPVARLHSLQLERWPMRRQGERTTPSHEQLIRDALSLVRTPESTSLTTTPLTRRRCRDPTSGRAVGDSVPASKGTAGVSPATPRPFDPARSAQASSYSSSRIENASPLTQQPPSLCAKANSNVSSNSYRVPASSLSSSHQQQPYHQQRPREQPDGLALSRSRGTRSTHLSPTYAGDESSHSASSPAFLSNTPRGGLWHHTSVSSPPAHGGSNMSPLPTAAHNPTSCDSVSGACGGSVRHGGVRCEQYPYSDSTYMRRLVSGKEWGPARERGRNDDITALVAHQGGLLSEREERAREMAAEMEEADRLNLHLSRWRACVKSDVFRNEVSQQVSSEVVHTQERAPQSSRKPLASLPVAIANTSGTDSIPTPSDPLSTQPLTRANLHSTHQSSPGWDRSHVALFSSSPLSLRDAARNASPPPPQPSSHAPASSRAADCTPTSSASWKGAINVDKTSFAQLESTPTNHLGLGHRPRLPVAVTEPAQRDESSPPPKKLSAPLTQHSPPVPHCRSYQQYEHDHHQPLHPLRASSSNVEDECMNTLLPCACGGSPRRQRSVPVISPEDNSGHNEHSRDHGSMGERGGQEGARAFVEADNGAEKANESQGVSIGHPHPQRACSVTAASVNPALPEVFHELIDDEEDCRYLLTGSCPPPRVFHRWAKRFLMERSGSRRSPSVGGSGDDGDRGVAAAIETDRSRGSNPKDDAPLSPRELGDDVTHQDRSQQSSGDQQQQLRPPSMARLGLRSPRSSPHSSASSPTCRRSRRVDASAIATAHATAHDINPATDDLRRQSVPSDCSDSQPLSPSMSSSRVALRLQRRHEKRQLDARERARMSAAVTSSGGGESQCGAGGADHLWSNGGSDAMGSGELSEAIGSGDQPPSEAPTMFSCTFEDDSDDGNIDDDADDGVGEDVEHTRSASASYRATRATDGLHRARDNRDGTDSTHSYSSQLPEGLQAPTESTYVAPAGSEREERKSLYSFFGEGLQWVAESAQQSECRGGGGGGRKGK